MNVLITYAKLYAEALMRALSGVRTSPWTLLLPAAFLLARDLSTLLLSRAFSLGGSGGQFLGGMVIAIVSAALLSGYFYFVGEQVAESRVTLGELRNGLARYLWSFVNLGFVLWVMTLGVRVIAQGAAAQPIWMFTALATFVLLNAAPEVIYRHGTYGGMATVQGSIRFIQANWIEWFIPNLALAAAWWFGWARIDAYAFGGLSALFEDSVLGTTGLSAAAALFVLVNSAVLSAFLHVFALFRGHLFKALDGTTHRQRMFRYRKQ